MVYLFVAALAAFVGVLLMALMIVAARADERQEREERYWRWRGEQELLAMDWDERERRVREYQRRGYLN